MQLGGAMTVFPTCPACGRENSVHGTADWMCGYCRAIIEWVEEVDGEMGWVVKEPPNEGVVEALARGEDPFAYVAPKIDPHAADKAFAHQRRAAFAEDAEPVTLGDLAKELGASCADLVKLGRTMGIFEPDKGGARTQLTYEHLTKLRDMWAIGGPTQHGQADEPEVVEVEIEAEVEA